jgi:hypothetical protein
MDIKFDLNHIKWIKDEHGLPSCVCKIKVPSVTSIINELIPDPEFDEFILKVGKEAADKIMVSAGNRGSATHTFIENFISKYSQCKDVSEALKHTQIQSVKTLKEEGIPDNKIEDGRNYFYKFYYSEYPIHYSDVIAIELGIYSPLLFYRGKLDILYRDKVYGISLTDFKTSSGKIKKNSTKELKYFLQLGGYALAIEHMYAEKKLVMNRASILCIDKNSDILQEVECSGVKLQEYKDQFADLVNQWHEKNGTTYLLKK